MDGYNRYDEWKGWGDDTFMTLSEHDRAGFDIEFRGIPVHGEHVLEIGFGNGALLTWFRQHGAEVYGTEISVEGAKQATERGVKVLDTDLENVGALHGHLGIVAAFDVLEHLTNRDIDVMFDKAAALLRTGGYFVARFPNGASPFGRVNQHGDMTHVNTLTETKIAQMIVGKPFEIVRAGDSAVPIVGNFPARLAKRGRETLRRAFEGFVGSLYGLKIPFYPNVTIILRKRGEN